MSPEDLMHVKIEDDADMEVINQENNNYVAKKYLSSRKMIEFESDIKVEIKKENIDDIDFIDNTKYLCEICDYYLPSLATLQDHMQGHNNTDINKENKLNKREIEKDTLFKENFSENHFTKDNDRFEDKRNTREKLVKTRKKNVTGGKDNGFDTKENKKNRKEYHRKVKDDRIKDKGKTTKEERKMRKYNVVEKKDEKFNEKDISTENTVNMRKKYHTKGKAKEKTTEKECKFRSSLQYEKNILNDSNVDMNKHNKKMIMSDCVVVRKNQTQADISKIEAHEEKSSHRVHIKPLVDNTNDDKANKKKLTEFIELKRDEGNKENSSEEFKNKPLPEKLPVYKESYKGFKALKKSRNQKSTCDICLKTYKSKESLSNHIREIHKGSKCRSRSAVHCELCSKKYSRKEYLDQHIKRFHLGIQKKWKCEFCGKYYCDMSALRRHKIYRCPENNSRQSAEIKKKANTCKLCKQKYVNLELFENHTANHPKYICDYCDITYYVKCNLVNHIKRVHLLVRHPCKLCGNQYVTRYNLHKHLRNKCLNFSHNKKYKGVMLQR